MPRIARHNALTWQADVRQLCAALLCADNNGEFLARFVKQHGYDPEALGIKAKPAKSCDRDKTRIELPEDLIDVAVGQVNTAITALLPGRRATLSALTSGQSGALVLRALISSDGHQEVDQVIKVGPAGLLLRELTAYEAYVQGRLNSRHFADVHPSLADLRRQSRRHEGRILALSYRLVGMGDLGELINECLTMDRADGIIRVIDQLFAVLRPWHNESKPDRARLTGQTMYGFRRPEESTADFVKAWNHFKDELPDVDPTHVLAIWNADAADQSTLRGPVHGDLHFENVRIREGDVVLIDFGACEDGHFLRDVVTLEAHLLIRLLCPKDPVNPTPEDHAAKCAPTGEQREFVACVLDFMKTAAFERPFENAPDGQPNTALIARLRRYAHACLMRGDCSLAPQYALGLLRHAIRLASRSDLIGTGRSWAALKIAHALATQLTLSGGGEVIFRGSGAGLGIPQASGFSFLQPIGWEDSGMPPLPVVKPTSPTDWSRVGLSLLTASSIDIIGVAPWPLLNALLGHLRGTSGASAPRLRYTTTPAPAPDPLSGVRWVTALLAARNYSLLREGRVRPVGESVHSQELSEQCVVCAEWPGGRTRVFASVGALVSIDARALPHYLLEIDDPGGEVARWVRSQFADAERIDLREIDCYPVDAEGAERDCPVALEYKSLTNYGEAHQPNTLRPIALVLPVYGDKLLFMFVRHPITDSDDFGKLSFPSARIRTEDIATANNKLFLPHFGVLEAEKEWLSKNCIEPGKALKISQETFQSAAARSFFKCTAIHIPCKEFRFLGLLVDNLDNAGRQRAYGVMRLDLTADMVGQVRRHDESVYNGVLRLLKEVQVDALLSNPTMANHFTQNHSTWLANEFQHPVDPTVS